MMNLKIGLDRWLDMKHRQHLQVLDIFDQTYNIQALVHSLFTLIKQIGKFIFDMKSFTEPVVPL